MAKRRSARIRGSDEIVAEAARAMRIDPTEAEAVLWTAIRDRAVNGAKFRRQHPVGRFVLDFCCPALKLVVEIDGSVHDDQLDRDRERSAVLAAAGYRVLRFRNEEVLNDLPGVLESIARTTSSKPDP